MSAPAPPTPIPAARRRRYSFGPFILDVDAGKVAHGSRNIALPSRAFDTLVYLIEHRERLVDKEELLKAVWKRVIVTDDSLIHAVSVLRRALVDESGPLPAIETVPRRGYRFVCPVEVDDGSLATHPGGRTPASPSASADAARTQRAAWPRPLLAWAIGAASVIAAVLAVAPRLRTPAPTPEVAATFRLFQPPPAGTDIVSGGVLSPDSRHLAFIARDRNSGKAALWLRRLQAGDAERIANTDGVSKPFWSPDGRYIAFFATGRIGVVDVLNEASWSIPHGEIAAAGGTWGADDTLVIADWASGLYAVAASGEGGLRQIRKLDRATQEIAYTWPQFLPDGRHFIYHVASLDPSRNGVYLGNVDSTRTEFLLETESPAVFAPPHHLLHVENGMLIADELDLPRLKPTGRSIVLARDVSLPSLGDGDIVSASGNLVAFRDGKRTQNLAWYDRTGKQLSSLPVPTTLFNPRVSPDESRVLATSSLTNDPGLWIASVSRAEYARLETDAIAPLWAPDGQRVAFTARGGVDLVLRGASSDGLSRPLLQGGPVKILNDWSPDGETIVYTQANDQNKLDLWSVSLADQRAAPLLATPFNEMQARLSPDGRWIAYVSDTSGALDVYVSNYPELSATQRVSYSGGGQPQWRSDRRELFFVSSDRELMAVDVADGEPLRLGTPRPLFRAPIGGGPADARDHYAVTADGQQFLVDSAATSELRGPITVMVNWAGATTRADFAHQPPKL